MPRTRPIERRVTVTLDGEAIEAELGEPVAATLLAAGKTTIARSPKFHRPRGPSCMRAACDGCLARVNETPNVMTCTVAAADGMQIVSQNRLGPRGADLLRMTDWFFPDGMNHHELFAGVPGVQTIMQGFARRVAGLGRLPADAAPMRPATRRTVDVVVIGGGPSGMAVAGRLAAAGRDVELVDDQLALGGGLRALATGFPRHDLAKVRVRPRTTVGAVYGGDLLVAGDEGAEVLEARATVFACGAHDGVLPFEGNDLPGVFSARAAAIALGHGVLVGERVVVVVSPGGGPFGAAFARDAAKHAKVEVVEGEPLGVRGVTRVKTARIRTAKGERTFDADALVVDAPRSPAYELAEQAGASLVHEMPGFVVVVDAEGRFAPGRWATGELVGVPYDGAAIEAHAELVAKSVLRA